MNKIAVFNINAHFLKFSDIIFIDIDKKLNITVHAKNVNRIVIAEPENRMESFFLAETLKYACLLQDPDTEVYLILKHILLVFSLS